MIAIISHSHVFRSFNSLKLLRCTSNNTTGCHHVYRIYFNAVKKSDILDICRDLIYR